ncbi:hypothetical protein [Rhizobium leguminosarum]|uniref:hypothetical protein n=1 Tax=Rhizobium leguminosarum TaxID=384 RepID=UPI000480A507|nr:hypothetical protein [Rhizobium leguminosarum]
MAEKSALADYLIKTTGLTLSPEKTKVTAMTEGFEFLGFRFSAHCDQRYGYGPRVEIPKAKAANLRHKVKQLTQRDRALLHGSDFGRGHPIHCVFHATRSNLGRPSSVIRLRTRTPIFASVF